MIGWIVNALGGRFWAVIAVLAVAGGVALWIYTSGGAAERVAQLKRLVGFQETVRTISDDVERMADDDVRKELEGGAQ